MASYFTKSIVSLASSSSVPLTRGKVTNMSISLRKDPVIYSASHRLTPNSFIKLLPFGTKTIASCGISSTYIFYYDIQVGHQFRTFHSDVAKVPSFDEYRLKDTKDPTSNTFESEMDRKFYMYTMALGCTVMGTVAAKYTIKTFLWTLGPGLNAKQAGKVEIKLDAIPEGKNLVIKWRSKPLFIKHRSEEEIARERAVPLSSLRDPETDEQRAQKGKWLICLGVCTHLGCIPIANSGDFSGGYYCPCHGSHYDASGRIRKGPAPKNLEVPPYSFLSDDVVLVG
ncbi:unnamed protein product [Protopolystoma xenopodis]|uniref:Rieske domain-containing protein n=1 Tax=Protopolystoma xenopodis TaxID=117903 RepID=A0A448WYN8_9PLAT|nr:unnamed protein product [Protopolystoma xenopodis]